MRKLKIGIIGCGNMGEAIIKAVASRRTSVASYDVDKKKLKSVSKKYKSKATSSSADLVKGCDIIILAVKPQNIDTVLKEIRNDITPYKLLISIAAGVKTSSIERKITKRVGVVRAMPNMPAIIQAGVSAVARGRFATDKDLVVAEELFKNMGEVVEVEEDFMDAVTAISGSGPAYFFYLAEVLIKMGRALGLKDEVARKLAIETALGSAKVLKETKLNPEVLRAKVTSRGGTTEAAFKEFVKGGLEEILKKGIMKAFERAKCL